MRLLASLLAVSGCCWLAVLVLSSSPKSGIEWLVPTVGLAYVAFGSLFVSLTREKSRLPGRFATLWVAAICLLLLLTLPQGGSFGALLMFVFVWATVAFIAWVVPPLVIWSYLRGGSIPPSTG